MWSLIANGNGKPANSASYYLSARRVLVDIAILVFIVTCFVLMHIAIGIQNDIRETRIVLLAQAAELKTAIQVQDKDLSTNLSHIAIYASVLIDRLDSQLTKARSQINDATQEHKQSSATDRTVITQAIKENTAQTAQATAAAVAHDLAQDVKSTIPPVIIAQVPSDVVEPALPLAPPPPLEPLIIRPVEPRRHSAWKRFWKHIFPFI